MKKSLPSLRPRNHIWLRACPGVVVFTLCLGGCMVGPNYHRPPAAQPAAYKESEGTGPWKHAHPQDDAARGQWWKVYNDSRLNALEEQVNISNQNVMEYEALFREAAAEVKVSESNLFPTVTSSPSVIGSGMGLSNAPTGAWQIPVSATYLVDIWGAVRRQIQSTSANAQASFANLENARLSYQATLAQDYFTLLGLDSQKRLYQSTVASYQKYLQLTTNKYNAGVASKGDVALAQTQLDTATVTLIDLGVNRAQFQHAIATLTGKPASEFSLPDVELHGIPPYIPPGIPSELLERRPDVASAERTVASANAQIGVQVAAYFPSLTINASTGINSLQLSQLFSGPSFFWSVGPVLAQTIFDAGHIHGLVQEAQANYEAQVAVYRQTVLSAIQGVEDNLSGLRILAKESEASDAAITSANKSLEIATNQYQAGTTDYLNVINDQTTALTNEVNGIIIRTRRMTTSVLLIENLGGGWNAKELPTLRQVSSVPQAQKQIDKGKQP